jgi:simple sugar transport system permease protein
MTTTTTPEMRPRVAVGELVRRPEAGALIGTIGVFIFFAIFSNSSSS